MESCGCLFVFILVVVIGLFCVFPILGILVLLFTFLIGHFGKSESILSSTISFLVGSSIFFVLFIILFALNLLVGGESNLFLGDTRYVNINDKYTFKQIDNGEFSIEGNLSLYAIDSIADTDDYVYGHLTKEYINGKTRDTYFTLSLKDGDIKKDTIFEYLELPAQCTRQTMKSAENYLYSKSEEQLRDWKEVVFWPFAFALALAFIISFFTKKLVFWIETKYKNWRNKSNKNKEDDNQQNTEQNNDSHNDNYDEIPKLGDGQIHETIE